MKRRQKYLYLSVTVFEALSHLGCSLFIESKGKRYKVTRICDMPYGEMDHGPVMLEKGRAKKFRVKEVVFKV
jgi:hypothetical protein